MKKLPRSTQTSFIRRAITWLVLLAHLLTAIPATAAASLKPAVSASKQPTSLIDTAQAATYLIASNFNHSANLQAAGALAIAASNSLDLRAITLNANQAVTLTGAAVDASGARSISSAYNNVTVQASGALNLSQATLQAAQDLTTAGGAGSFTVGARLAAGRDLNVTTTDRVNINSTVTGSSVNLISGGDTTIRGGVVSGNTVTAIVGGNLTIESPIDTSSYKETGSTAGFGISYNIVTGAVSGSLSAGSTHINSTLNSVGTQSAINAGNGGFYVDVAGNTTLTGGAITSSQTAVNNNANFFATQGTLTTTDIVNSATFNANQTAVNVGIGPKPGGSTGITGGGGLGNASGNATSVTSSGISGIAGNTAVRTGDTETGLKPIFNATAVRADVGGQTAVSSAFGPAATNAWGNYANGQANTAKTTEEAACWKEGGACRVAGHTVIGGLTGGTGGAVGAATSQTLIPLVGAALQDQDIPPLVRDLIVAGLGAVIGGATGGTAGAVAGGNATVNNYLSDPERNALDAARKSCYAAQPDSEACKTVTRLNNLRYVSMTLLHPAS